MVMADGLVAAAAQLLISSSGYALLTISCLLLPAAALYLLLSPTTTAGRSAGGGKQLQSSVTTTTSGRRDNKMTKQPQQLPLPPSPPGGLPIVGHLHLLVMGQQQPHVALRDLARKHGHDDLMLLRLGAVPNLVVSSARAAEAVMRTHDHVFASRPPSTLVDVLMRGAADVAFAPYGEPWRQGRKLVTTHLLSVRKVASFSYARQEEVRRAIAKIRDEAAAGVGEVDVGDLLHCYANDVVCRAVSGNFFMDEAEEGGRRRNQIFRDLIAMNVAFLDGFNVEDYFPRLARSFFHPLTRVLCGNNKKTNKWQEGWHDLLDKLIDGHAAAAKSSSSTSRNQRQQADDDVDEAQQQQETDFIDVLLSVQQDYGLTRNHMKAILIDMFAAGIDTSYITMEYALAELVRNPRIMAKLQAEVRTNTPKSQDMVKEENLGSMPYLKAVVKETLRLHPPVPLLLHRHSMADCSIDGYMIPAQTRVIINAWAISRDPRYWDRPEEFLPERFIITSSSSSAVDFKGSDFQFTPFGAGRRICPGLNFGLASVEIMLANLIYCFDWELPPPAAGVGKKQDIDMTDAFGLTMRRKEKLFLVPKQPYHHL